MPLRLQGWMAMSEEVAQANCLQPRQLLRSDLGSPAQEQGGRAGYEA